jgi:hypothetical protein
MNLGNRNSQHSFATMPAVKSSRSVFDRSFTVKDTFDFDYLIPFFCDEILPGDTARLNVSSFARLATQIKPIMDNMYIDYHFFFVPSRLVWDNWERFNGAQDDPGDSTDFTVPQIVSRASTGESVGSIWDKFGLPTQVPGISVSALPFRAYKKIWNDWFRDQNLQNSVVVDRDDGPDLITDSTLYKRAKKHDYFTSCLPFPQKGAAVTLPLGSSAPVVGSGTTMSWLGVTSGNGFTPSAAAGGVNPSIYGSGAGATANEAFKWSNSGLIADLSDATAATINALREAFQIQSLLELDARGGTRYVEILLAHWNVTSPDFRLQRSEYLGGGSQRINSHPVAQTAPTSGTDAQADLAAFGTSQGTGIGFSKSFVEHGYVIGLVSARADITYQQGVNRMWSRQTRFDYFWPKLQELGEQPVLNQEIYAQGSANPTQDLATFGYQERYAEYRYKPSEIRGQFRSTYAQTLDVWHLAEEFGSLPALNATFIQQSTPIERAIAVTSEPDLLADFWFNYNHARVMMTYSVPVSLGRM